MADENSRYAVWLIVAWFAFSVLVIRLIDR